MADCHSARYDHAMRLRFLLLMLTAAWMTPSAAHPQPAPETADPGAAYQPPEFISSPVVLPEGTGNAVRPLSLEAAIKASIENNLGIVLSRQSFGVARASELAARGLYEPTINASYLHYDQLVPPTTAQEGDVPSVRYKIDRWTAGIAQPLWTGTTLSLDFATNRQSSDSETAPGDVTIRSTLDLRVTQKLLRGFSLDLEVPRAQILVAELETRRVSQDIRTQMMATTQATEDAYWDLVYRLKAFKVQSDSNALALEQLELTRKQIAAGLLAPSALIEAESTLAQRQLNLVQAEAAIGVASDRLREVMAVPRAQWAGVVLPTNAPTFDVLEVEEGDAIDRALRLRPVLQAGKIEIEQRNIDLRVAQNARLPQLDLQASYGLVGQSLERDPDPAMMLPGQSARFGEAMDQLVSNDARAWQIMLNFSWAPLGRVARAQIEIAELQRDRATRSLDQAHMTVLREVRAAARSLKTAARGLRAAARFRELATRSLENEQKMFVTGTSSNYLVAQKQDSVRLAQEAELAAMVAHKRASTALQRTIGDLLDKRGIKVRIAK